MEFALILRELWARKRLLALGILVAGLVSLLSVYRIDGFGLKRRTLQYSSATVCCCCSSRAARTSSTARSSCSTSHPSTRCC